MNVEVQTKGIMTPTWSDCHEAQCRQVHDLLDSLGEVLGLKFSASLYTVGKAVHVFQAIDRLKNPANGLLERYGCHKMVAQWVEGGTYRSVCHRHDGTYSAVDESERLFMRADTIPLLADALMNWPDGAEKLPPSKYVKVYDP